MCNYYHCTIIINRDTVIESGKIDNEKATYLSYGRTYTPTHNPSYRFPLS